jgi:hypothetical protein
LSSGSSGSGVHLINSPKTEAGSAVNGSYNIFRSALKRGTELLKSTFLANASLLTDPSDSPSHFKPIPQKQQSDTPQTVSSDSSRSSSSSSASETQSEGDDDCSSPDSIKTELMLFKPISREPRTKSANAKLVRVPSIRSTSSTSSVVHSPCPSPFFIPMTPQRHSAFSFVQFESAAQLQPKTTNKRKLSKNTKDEKKSEEASPKRQKKVHAPSTVKKQTRTVKNAPLQVEQKDEKTENMRETRSRKRNLNESVVKVEEMKVALEVAAKEFKSPLKPAPKRRNVAQKSLEDTAAVVGDDNNNGRRVTRSRSMKY